MRSSVTAAVATMVAVAFPAPAGATWSAPVRIPADAAGPTAVAVNARGDAVVAWATRRSTGTAVQVSARSKTGRRTSKRVWSSTKLAVDGISIVIDRRGEITLAWSSMSGAEGHGDTVRATFRSPAGRWAPVHVIGHSYDEPLPPERFPRLAVALDGRVLLAWDARSDPWESPGRPTVAWRNRGERFGTAHALKGAPQGLGPIPAFDALGRAYIWGRCNGVVLRTSPASRNFRFPTVFATHALGFNLALGDPGEGLATWIDGRCTSDPAAGSILGPVRASVLHAGAFGSPLALTDAGFQGVNTTVAAWPAGGGIASWAGSSGVFSAQIGAGGTMPGARPVADGLVAHALTASGDLILTGATTFPTSFVQGGVRILPAGSGTPESAPATAGQLAVAAPTGRAAALLFDSVELSIWRP